MQILPTILDLLKNSGSLDKYSTRAVGDLLPLYEGQSILRPIITHNDKTSYYQFTVMNTGGSMVAMRSADASSRFRLPSGPRVFRAVFGTWTVLVFAFLYLPILVLVACVLMALQPRLAARVAERRAAREDVRDVGAAPMAIAFAAGIYGGYFGAAQGVILLAMLSVFVPDDLQRSNALKNVLAGTVNAVAAVIFVIFADVAWEAVALVAVGAVIGGVVGSRVGRKIPPTALRAAVIVLGVFVAIRFFVT